MPTNTPMKLFLSAGHHKARTGASNKQFGLTEHQQALRVLRAFEDFNKLTNRYEIVKEEGGLINKVATCNEFHPDLAMDIHFNADFDHLDPFDENDDRGRGVMVMYCPNAKEYGQREEYSIRHEQADKMSSVLYKESGALNSKDLRGRAGWYWGSLENGKPTKRDYFLRKTNCPAFIPELGFIDNNAFAKQLIETDLVDRLALALDESIQAIRYSL